jgi:hypothetical protein
MAHPTSWVTQMEHYLSLHDITDELAKLWYGVLHLDLNVGNGGNGEKCPPRVCGLDTICCRIYERFDTDTHHLGRLTKLKQYGIVEDFIASFECLDFHTEGMFDAFFGNALLVASRMRYVPMSSWISLKVGWKLLKHIRKHNILTIRL